MTVEVNGPPCSTMERRTRATSRISLSTASTSRTLRAYDQRERVARTLSSAKVRRVRNRY